MANKAIDELIELKVANEAVDELVELKVANEIIDELNELVLANEVINFNQATAANEADEDEADSTNENATN